MERGREKISNMQDAAEGLRQKGLINNNMINSIQFRPEGKDTSELKFKANLGMGNVVDDDDFLGENNYGLNPMANETLNATMTTNSVDGGTRGIAPAKVKKEVKDYDENA